MQLLTGISAIRIPAVTTMARRIELIMPEHAKSTGDTENLKAADPMKWGGADECLQGASGGNLHVGACLHLTVKSCKNHIQRGTPEGGKRSSKGEWCTRQCVIQQEWQQNNLKSSQLYFTICTESCTLYFRLQTQN